VFKKEKERAVIAFHTANVNALADSDCANVVNEGRERGSNGNGRKRDLSRRKKLSRRGRGILGGNKAPPPPPPP